MRTTRVLLASAVCALLAGCDGGALTAPDGGPLAIDTQCPEADCGGTTVTPAYGLGSHVGSVTNYSPVWPFVDSWTRIGRSWSDINNGRYTHASVSSTASLFESCRPTSYSHWGSQSKTVYGVGRAEVTFRYETNMGLHMRVIATHFFKASSKYPWLTDLTLQTEANDCG